MKSNLLLSISQKQFPVKNLMLPLFVAAFGLLSFFPFNKTSDNQSIAPEKGDVNALSPIDGSWELYSTEIAGRVTIHKKPKQFKMFHNGFVSLMMYDSLGKFEAAGAGTFELEGNKYKETFTYSSWPEVLGASNWQEWAMKGDTLLFYGFKKVTDANGRDITKDWGGDHFIEKRLRAKK